MLTFVKKMNLRKQALMCVEFVKHKMSHKAMVGEQRIDAKNTQGICGAGGVYGVYQQEPSIPPWRLWLSCFSFMEDLS
jgi:hypothetical protein